MEKLKIMFLGFTGSGKTYLQGSFFKLAYATGNKGINLQSLKFNEKTEILEIHDAVSGKNIQIDVPTTMNVRTSDMVLKKGMNKLFDVDITDLEGQALEAGRNKEVSDLIINIIPEYHGLILVIEYPINDGQLQDAQRELGQLLNFAGVLLEKNPNIPLALVINKIDKIENSEQIKSLSDEEITELKKELSQQFPNQRQTVNKLARQREGTIVNKYVKPLVEEDRIWGLCGQFFTLIKNTSSTIPAKVFMASSLGFGSKNKNNDDLASLMDSSTIYTPYGGVAALLWTIYARLMMMDYEDSHAFKGKFRNPFPKNKVQNKKELIEDLKSDIQELYATGQAYFDPDDNSPENIWAMRNCIALRAGIDT